MEQTDFDGLLALAGVSSSSYVREGTWRRSWMTATDLALIWSALVQGRLLGDEMTDLVIGLAETADIPDDKETFPDSGFTLDGYRHGQKAGYNVEDGVPYHLVGASFLVPIGSPGRGVVAVLLITSEVEDLLDEQRRSVFPLVVEYLETVEPVAE